MSVPSWNIWRDPHDPLLDVEASLRLSYEALPAAARSALCQVSVFPVSFGADAAQKVIEAPSGNEVDDVLEELCFLSLLEWDEAAQRYSLHDLVRVFASARLEDTETVRLRHARHYMVVADTARAFYHQGGAVLLAGLALFDRERAHIDVGWAWTVASSGNTNADALLLNYANATASIASLRYDARHKRIPLYRGTSGGTAIR